jgi:hypothetical protein
MQAEPSPVPWENRPPVPRSDEQRDPRVRPAHGDHDYRSSMDPRATMDNRYSSVTHSPAGSGSSYRRPVREDELREQWRRDAELLGGLGRALEQVPLPTITVRLPWPLATAAVAAWERDDGGPLGPEDAGARLDRHRAGTLALIGAAVREHGRPDGDGVLVALGVELVALARDAADDLPP